MPTRIIPSKAWVIARYWFSGAGRRGTITSIAAAIIIALSMVPMPGFSFNGIHSIRTRTLTKKVVCPTDQSILMAMPSAKTVQGVFPMPAAMRIASPVPNTHNPIMRITRVFIRGLRVRGSSALQIVVGTSFAGRSTSNRPMVVRNTGRKSNRCIL